MCQKLILTHESKLIIIVSKTKVAWEDMTITSLKSALQRIAQLERENEQLRAELEVYKNRNTGGRKKHDEAWMTSYRDFAVKYESGMTIMEIVAEGEISRRTAYRYKAYYDELQKNNRYKKRNEQVLSGINPTR